MRKRSGFDIIDFAKYGMIVIIIAYVVFLLMREGDVYKRQPGCR